MRLSPAGEQGVQVDTQVKLGMIIDEAVISVKAGDGGDGCVSFRRERFVAKGGPDGGKGGDGGQVYFRAVSDLAALRRFRYEKNFEAEAGKPGQPRKKTGKDGEDLELKVPVGTLIKDVGSGEGFELLQVGEQVQIASGGFGGRGNFEFRSSINRTPQQFERGGRGQRRKLYLELRIMADIGLVGLPNAGKSSLLNALTRAKAQVANYPFTTLEPNLGTLDGLILADIPGLIEGAAQGRGLGHKFLRHVRRTKILAHLISVESATTIKDYQTIRQELKEFDEELLKKKEIIVLTKVDLVDRKTVTLKLKQLQRLKLEVIPCSVMEPETLAKVKTRLLALASN